MNDVFYMNLALDLAKSTVGQTSPNPAVGAVVVKNHIVVGFGAHLKAGEAHAEVHALQMAGDKAIGATLYVTLEPCSHTGKTPPCAELVIRTGVKRVVVATTDKNPAVAGAGIKRLREAGITVDVGLLKEEADNINDKFFHYMTTGLPYVTLKAAISLDGKIATHTGDSKWITSSEAREDVHQFRHTHDAILVGVGTVIADNPSLTTRFGDGCGKHATRIILDTTLRTPLESQVVQDGLARTIIITGANTKEEHKQSFIDKGVEVISLPFDTLHVTDILRTLSECQITSVFVEGGSGIHGSFLEAQAFQQCVMYIAPKLIGGKHAPTAFSGTGFATISDTLSLDIRDITHIGNDIRIIATPKEGE